MYATDALDTPSINISELTLEQWLGVMRRQWKQGEHVAIIGPTGYGKTTLARYLLPTRDYVCALAVKKHDDTIEKFKKPWHYPQSNKIMDSPYKIITKWPPLHSYRKVVLWIKPKDLRSDSEQGVKVYEAINSIYDLGGWCIFFDDVGYITSQLKLAGPFAVLLSQGRSSYISIVAAMTQPSSVAMRVPSEALRQVRHVIAFRYGDEREVIKIAQIAGCSASLALELNALLHDHDFLYFHSGQQVVLVRNSD